MRPPPTHTLASQPARDRKDRTAHTRNTHTTHRDAETPSQHNTHPRPPQHQQCHSHTTTPRPPPRDQATDATHSGPRQPMDVDAPADTHRDSPLPRPPQETPSPDPTRDNDDRPPKPTPPPPSHTAPPAAAPAEPYAVHNPAAVLQHLRGLGDQEVLRLHTSGTTERIQAATLGRGVRDFLFDAFVHVARHDRPPLATPDGESPPLTGDRIWVPPIYWGRHLVGHPVPEREDTQCRTRYREPNKAHCCGLFLGNSTCAPVPLCFSKSEIRNPKSTNLAGSLDGGTIITQSRRHKPCSEIEVSYSAHSQLAFDASLLFTDCSAIATATCDLRAAALLLFEAITLPPP